MLQSLLFVTGTRADFGKLEPLAVAARDAGFDVSFFVTGMHMLDRYGLTKIEVNRVEDVSVYEFQNQQEGDPQDLVLANTVTGFTHFIAHHKPDLIIVHGDRIEALACALVAATNYIRCAHIEGGEVSGTIDEIFRHCNTKLAYCHYVSSQQAAKRVQAMGEPADTIHVIGSPELDFHANDSSVSIEEVRTRYEITFEEFGICIFHPVTSEKANMGEQAKSLFNELVASKKAFVVILPNNDPGSDSIMEQINSLPTDRFRIIPSMRFSYFSELMKNASAMIGNSSAGVREAPFLGLPSLDIGTRQTNRSLAPTVFSCTAFDKDGIAEFMKSQWGKKHDSHAGFGEGRAALRFIETLQRPEFWERSLQKQFCELA